MSAITIFWLSSIILVGLQLCVPEKVSDACGTYENQLAEKFWTDNYVLRRFYGLSYLLGLLSVVAAAGYLTFAAHWWYILVYIGSIVGAKVCAFILKLGIVLIFNPIDMFDRLKFCRIAGSFIVCATIVTSILILVI